MSGQPGAGCDDPRAIHFHWCGFCGAEVAFTSAQCRQLLIVPPCPRCRETDWRSDVDELTAPDHRESVPPSPDGVSAAAAGGHALPLDAPVTYAGPNRWPSDWKPVDLSGVEDPVEDDPECE